MWSICLVIFLLSVNAIAPRPPIPSFLHDSSSSLGDNPSSAELALHDPSYDFFLQFVQFGLGRLKRAYPEEYQNDARIYRLLIYPSAQQLTKNSNKFDKSMMMEVTVPRKYSGRSIMKRNENEETWDTQRRVQIDDKPSSSTDQSLFNLDFAVPFPLKEIRIAPGAAHQAAIQHGLQQARLIGIELSAAAGPPMYTFHFNPSRGRPRMVLIDAIYGYVSLVPS